MAELKTSIKELTSCNERITVETAKQCKVSEARVNDFMSFIGAYIGDVIRTGAMETVALPHWGKFKANQKTLTALKNKNRNETNGKDMVWRAMTGKSVIDLRPKPENNENTTSKIKEKT